jgi:hypothetical protein
MTSAITTMLIKVSLAGNILAMSACTVNIEEAAGRGMSAGPDVSKVVVNPNALFVSLEGSDTNDGRTMATALRTIFAAAQRAEAGETIYVAPGDYGNEQITFANQGIPGSPITLEGYRFTPGDRPVLPGFDHLSSLDPSAMPLLDGGNRSSGTGFDLGSAEYIIVRNFQVTNYLNGFHAYDASHIIVEDMILTTFGINNKNSYSGKGIIFGSNAHHNTLKNSVVVNAGAEGMMLYGNNNRIEGCRVYGSSGGGSNVNHPDYYMMIQGNRNIIEGSLVQRVGNLSHGGHGIGIKGFGSENIIRNNTGIGFRGSHFYVRHRGVIGNLFSGNLARNGGFGMTFRDGASNNIVEHFYTEGVNRAVVFLDTREDGGKQFSGKNNIVRDSTFLDTKDSIVTLHDYVYNDVYATGNVMENIIIDGAPLLFDVRSYGAKNVFRDSTINNVQRYIRAQAPRVKADAGFTLIGNTGTGNGFSLH